MTTTTERLARTPFYQYHVDHGAKMVPFAGWEMPLHYGSIIDEHQQVRRSGGLFDVSHMGRLRFTGRDARRFLDRVCTRLILGMQPGQVRYSLVCNEQGGCRDDVLVYCIDGDEYLMVCNASNREKLMGHFESVKGEMTFKLRDETEQSAMVALQGPRVIEMLSAVSSEIPGLKRYRFATKNVLIAKFLISRTGYTGEDGVEVIFPGRLAAKAVGMLIDHAQREGEDIIKPAGLGARDSLRLEAGMALYGHEISEELDPISAGLDFAVKLNKGEEDPEAGRFIGQDALERIAAEGPRQKLVGLVLEGRRAARQDARVQRGGEDVGVVTSGCLSPSLGQSIAMAYVRSELAQPGEGVSVAVGSQAIAAEVVAMPFYKRA